MANHGAAKFDPRKMTLSSILYIIILDKNIIIYSQGEIRARERTRTREGARFEACQKKLHQKEKFLIYGFVNPT